MTNSTHQHHSTRRSRQSAGTALTVAAAVSALTLSACAKKAEPVKERSLAQAMMEVRAENCSGRSLKGTGVRMEVFASGDLSTTPVQAGHVPVLDMNVTPANPVQPGQTVRWTGWVKGPEAGKHFFHLPQGVVGTLTVSNADVITPATPDTGGTAFEKDRFYAFTLVVKADKPAADAGTWLLSWSHDASEPQPVTRGFLFPPSNVKVTRTDIASR